MYMYMYISRCTGNISTMQHVVHVVQCTIYMCLTCLCSTCTCTVYIYGTLLHVQYMYMYNVVYCTWLACANWYNTCTCTYTVYLHVLYMYCIWIGRELMVIIEWLWQWHIVVFMDYFICLPILLLNIHLYYMYICMYLYV